MDFHNKGGSKNTLTKWGCVYNDNNNYNYNDDYADNDDDGDKEGARGAMSKGVLD